MFFQSIVRVLALLAADAVTIAGVWMSVVTSYHYVWDAHYRYGVEFYWQMWPVVPVFVALNALFRLYHGNMMSPSAPVPPVEEMRRLIGSSLITHLGAIAAIVLMRQTMLDYSRLVVVVSGVLTALLAQPARDVVRLVLHRFRLGQIPVVILGSGKNAQSVASVCEASAYVGFRAVGYFGERDESFESVAWLGTRQDVVAASRRKGVRILISCEDSRLFRCQLKELMEWFTYIEYCPMVGAFPVSGSRTVSLSGIGGIEMVNQARMRLMRVEKWLLDKTCALVAFALLLPVFVIVPVLIKLTSRGPVFYRQRRLGKNGCEIRVWKFRSMYADADERLSAILAANPAKKAEWEANFKLADDPRVTPLGRFLRRTSIDEFPQFFNVLAGDMALVGPRPIVEKEVAYYGESYAVFSSVKPGVTGLWQASGRSGTGYAHRVALDVEYVLNWSPWLDVWILFKTAGAVLLMRGAC